MPKKLDKKTAIAVISVVLTVAILAWLAFFYQIGKVQELSEAVQKEKLDSFVKQEKKDKMLKLQKELSDVENRKNEMNNMFISKDDAVPFLRSLEEIAADTSSAIKIEAADLSKLKLDKSSAAANADDETAAKVTADQQAAQISAEKAKQDQMNKIKNNLGFTVEVTGSFSSLVDFLDKMEGLPNFIQVYTMDLGPAGKDKQVAPASGVLATGNQGATAASQDLGAENKNVKITLLIIVSSK